jgi:hypothetical protein
MPGAPQAQTENTSFLGHLIIFKISLQEDIDSILTGLRIYFSLWLDRSWGGGDGETDRCFAFSLDGNRCLFHPLRSVREGCFFVSTGMSILQFFWGPEISGKETGPRVHPQQFGREKDQSQRLQRKTGPSHFLGHLV